MLYTRVSEFYIIRLSVPQFKRAKAFKEVLIVGDVNLRAIGLYLSYFIILNFIHIVF